MAHMGHLQLNVVLSKTLRHITTNVGYRLKLKRMSQNKPIKNLTNTTIRPNYK